MCNQPSRLKVAGVWTEVACHKCPQCRAQRVTDWEGRNIAESKTSVASHWMALTYGRNEEGLSLHPKSVVLTYSDVQVLFKRLRFFGYPLRYFVAGEYGSRYQRAHWHAIIHWTKRVPAGIVLDDPRHMWGRFDEETGEQGVDENGAPAYFWDHGFAHVQRAKSHNVRYAAQYVLDDQADDLADGMIRMSKKPPIGWRYFDDMAARFVADHLAPQDLQYRFPDVRKRDGMPKEYRLRGRIAEMFLESYCQRWERAYPGKAFPPSRLVDIWRRHGFICLTDEQEQRLMARQYEEHEYDAKYAEKIAISERQQREREAAEKLKNWRRERAKEIRLYWETFNVAAE